MTNIIIDKAKNVINDYFKYLPLKIYLDTLNNLKTIKFHNINIHILYDSIDDIDLNHIKKVLKRDLWWDAAECMKYGLIDGLWNGTRIGLNISKEFGSEHFSTTTVSATRNLKRKRDGLDTTVTKNADPDDSSDSDSSEPEAEVETVSKAKVPKRSKRGKK